MTKEMSNPRIERNLESKRVKNKSIKSLANENSLKADIDISQNLTPNVEQDKSNEINKVDKTCEKSFLKEQNLNKEDLKEMQDNPDNFEVNAQSQDVNKLNEEQIIENNKTIEELK